MLNLGGNLSPEQQIEQQQIARQQRMAELLMQQGQQIPQGQMVSGRYVAPNFFQYAAPLLQGYLGKKELEKVEQRQLDLAKRLRADEISAMTDYFQQLQPQPAQPAPAGYDLIDAGTPAIPANPKAALLNLYTNPKATQAQRQFAFQKMNADPEAFTLAEGAKRFITMPNGTVKEVAAGGEKPRSPVSVGNYLIDPVTGKVIFQAPEKPTAGQVVERDDGTFLIDTRTGQARQVLGQGGKPLEGGGKPLTETQSNAVAFGARAIAANKIATDLEKQGVTNTGVIRSVVGGIVGQAPIVGERLEQGVRSAFNPVPSVLGGPSGEQQQVEQARRNFISAVLRKESGAAIAPSEYANEEKKYFPQIGDTQKTIDQKQEARRLAIKALEAQAGPSGTRQINKITNEMTGGADNVVDFNSLPKGR